MRRLGTLIMLLGLLGTALAACEAGTIVRGSGSEHRQHIRVGVPF
jgi:hypothetical protein